MVQLVKMLAGPFLKRMMIGTGLRAVDGFLSLLPVVVLYHALLSVLFPETAAGWGALACGVSLLGIVLVRFGVHSASISVGHMTGFKILERLRLHYADRLRQLPVSWYSRRDLGEISGALLHDLSSVEPVFVEKIAATASVLAQVVGGVCCIALVDWRLALLAASGLVPGVLLMRWINGRLAARMPERIAATSDLVSRTVEFCHGISVIKLFSLKGKRAALYTDAAIRHRDVNLGLVKYVGTAAILYFTCLELGYAGLVGFGFPLNAGTAAGNLYFAHFVFAAVMCIRVYGPTHELVDLLGFMQQMAAAARRLKEVDDAPLLPRPVKTGSMPAESSVSFTNVSFAYESDTALSDVSFVVPAKSMTAIVGMSGAGKSTIASLLCRFWDVDSGSILIGGVDIRNMTEKDMWNQISVVFQRVSLFDDSIRENIRFARPSASDEEVSAAARAARCSEFIDMMPKGYDTLVGENGCNLSGGQRQRLSIARAILKDSPIIVLDEATASVDLDNERMIQEAIQNLVSGKTLLLIAHRLATVVAADQILVVEGGSILERGSHDTLVAADGRYARMWEQQTAARSIVSGHEEAPQAATA
ncbi:ABC transporter ATP-binding protein [Pseudodesulfovibrio piezophilus]|nr:ABC transporter ATP-binding protein [Pseudodesulfovibrio piezophilus]